MHLYTLLYVYPVNGRYDVYTPKQAETAEDYIIDILLNGQLHGEYLFNELVHELLPDYAPYKTKFDMDSAKYNPDARVVTISALTTGVEYSIPIDSAVETLEESQSDFNCSREDNELWILQRDGIQEPCVPLYKA
jgi:hypothetical protein